MFTWLISEKINFIFVCLFWTLHAHQNSRSKVAPCFFTEGRKRLLPDPEQEPCLGHPWHNSAYILHTDSWERLTVSTQRGTFLNSSVCSREPREHKVPLLNVTRDRLLTGTNWREKQCWSWGGRCLWLMTVPWKHWSRSSWHLAHHLLSRCWALSKEGPHCPAGQD